MPFIQISILWKWIIDEMSRRFSCRVVMGMPAAGRVGLWLSLVQGESSPQGFLAQQGEVGWRLHRKGCSQKNRCRRTTRIKYVRFYIGNAAEDCVIPAMVSSILVSTFSSSRTDSSTVSTLGSFSFARASNSYSSRSVSVGSKGKFPAGRSRISLASPEDKYV